MSADLLIDPRLPPLVEITEPNRQQRRRCKRNQATCAKCRRSMSPDDACFADGQDSHRSCAERWNQELLEGWDELRAQDAGADSEQNALAMGLTLPRRRQWAASDRAPTDPARSASGLWIPPAKTPAASAAMG